MGQEGPSVVVELVQKPRGSRVGVGPRNRGTSTNFKLNFEHIPSTCDTYMHDESSAAYLHIYFSPKDERLA